MAARAKKEIPFEEGMERLQAVVERLEGGELALEELLKLYEEGMKLSGELAQKLDAAQNRMQLVRADAEGRPVVEATEAARQESLLDALDGDGRENA